MVMFQGWLKLDQIGWKWFKHVQTCSKTQLRHHVAKANMQHTLRLLQWCERLLVINFSSPDGKLEELNRAALQALLSFLRDTCCGGTRCFWSWLCRSFVYNAVKHNLVDGVPWRPCKPCTPRGSLGPELEQAGAQQALRMGTGCGGVRMDQHGSTHWMTWKDCQESFGRPQNHCVLQW